MHNKKIIISGGGTAGHLYPALSVGKKLKEIDPSVKLTFTGSSRNLERKIMSHYQAEFISIKIEGIRGKGLKIIRPFILLPLSFIKSLKIIRKIKPDLVIGMGGYSSGPLVLLASLIKVPTLILEQNLHPGFTNRLLIPRVKKAAVSFENSLPYFKGKGIFLGNPVREEFYKLPFKARNNKLSLLIFGGSQGSHFLNCSIINSLPFLKKEKEHLKIFHQTGNKDYEWVKKNYSKNGFFNIEVSPYFFNMANYFSKSDIIICRAGATSIAELIAAQKASLLIPFAQATDNHQFLNARELKRINSAEVMLENEVKGEKLADKIFYFIKNREKINQMEKNLSKLRTENSAEKIAQFCFELIEKNSRKRSHGKTKLH